jgi:hypothetical protein
MISYGRSNQGCREAALAKENKTMFSFLTRNNGRGATPKQLLTGLGVLLVLACSTASAQNVQSVMADEIVPSGDYITQSGVPGCGSNPFDAVQAAAGVIAGAYTGGWTGALTGVLNALVQGYGPKVGGAAGDVLQFFNGPRYASCKPVSVVVPAGSRITGYSFAARDGYGSGPCNADGNGLFVCSVGWSAFEPIQVVPAGNSMIVTGIFKNWSHDRERGATLTVYFIPPY